MYHLIFVKWATLKNLQKLLFEANTSLLKFKSKTQVLYVFHGWENLQVWILFAIQMPPTLAWMVVLSFLWQNELNNSFMQVIKNSWQGNKEPFSLKDSWIKAANAGVYW